MSALFQSRLEAVRARIVDLDGARYVRGEFSTPDDIARWNHMMERLKLQRDAVAQELGPPPDFDLASLRATYSEEVWDGMPLPQRRKATAFGWSSLGRSPKSFVGDDMPPSYCKSVFPCFGWFLVLALLSGQATVP